MVAIVVTSITMIDDSVEFRAFFCQEILIHIAAADTLDGQAKVIGRSKDGRPSKIFEALDGRVRAVAHLYHQVATIIRAMASNTADCQR